MKVALGIVSSILAVASCVADMPPPFTRELSVGDIGGDVSIMQGLLSHYNSSVAVDGVFALGTQAALVSLQAGQLPNDKQRGTLDEDTANLLLTKYYRDGITWQDVPNPRDMGLKYLVHVPVHQNRSIETNATLYCADMVPQLSFRVRAHGHDAYGPNPWPTFNSTGNGLNMFSPDGNTPTGVYVADLNSPESDPKEYGPYPVNRLVHGFKGNAAFMIPDQRHGILMHTGQWSEYAGWEPPQPMPNSAGCIHGWPEDIEQVWHILTDKCGVTVNTNSGGAQPYPYQPQGLFAVIQVDDQ